MKYSLIVCALLWSNLSGIASPGSGALTLTSGGTNNQLELTLAVGFLTDTQTTTLTGTVSLDADIDIDTAIISNIALTGEEIAFSDLTFNFSSLQTVTTSGLRGSPITLNPPAPVNPPSLPGSSQTFDASFHNVNIDQGTVVAAGIQNETIDLNSEPLLAGGEGQGTISLTVLTSTVNATDYNAVFTLPINSTQPITNASGQTLGQLTAAGTLNAAGIIRVYTNGFVQWAVENDLTSLGTSPSFTADSNGDTLPDGVAWALGLSSEEVTPDPISLVADSATLALPQTGTAAKILIQQNTSLASDSWTPATLMDHPNPLPAGSSGNIQIQNSTDRVFYRIFASPTETLPEIP